ncbi:MAG TPA: flavin reductase family protein [Candidatus Didemnitutus sp.]|jgi:flavin reductase (DIM6/NTAB) family NADH-FMN oxidoreductase RutF
MVLDFTTLPPRDSYGWLVSAITPRPIAWVSSMSSAGVTNLAPFSFFQGVCANPPTLLFVGANDRTGKKKDTVLNVEQVPEFVVNIVPFRLREPMNQTSASLPYGESEFEKFEIPTAPSSRVRPPRVAAAPVCFECRLDRIVRIGEGPLSGNVVFGTIILAHVDDAILGADGRIDPQKLDTIGRMGGDLYTRTTDRFAIQRPA